MRSSLLILLDSELKARRQHLLPEALEPRRLMVVYGGVDFPQGASSFADTVISYAPTGGVDPPYKDPTNALGIPNGPDVSLGSNGVIVVGFSDNLLSNSASTSKDLWIFEVGPSTEPTFVSIHPTAATRVLLPASGDTDGDGYYEVGRTSGGTSGIDIDAFFPGHTAGKLAFDAVKVRDDPSDDGGPGPYAGADIDAVGAISSRPPPEVDVRGNNVAITDGDTTPSATDYTDFGNVAQGAGGPTRTFTVKNTGAGSLNTLGLGVFNQGSTSPSTAFTILEGLSATIAPGGSDTFTVRLNTTNAGTFTREIRFANDDPNENPYSFTIRGVVNPPPTFSLMGGVLTVNGTSGDDYIRGSISSNVLTMKMNSLSQSFSNASGITRIVVNGLAGDDLILLASSVNRPTSLNGGDGNDTISGGSGTDAINGGAGTDSAFRTGSDTTTLVEEILA